MALSTYDDIWQCFLDNCGLDVSALTTDSIKTMIHNASRHYNSETNDTEIKLTYDDINEVINVELDNTRLLLLAYCIKYTELQNQLENFEQVWQPFQKEVGQKFYSEQIKGRESTLARTEKKITELLTDLDSGTVMD